MPGVPGPVQQRTGAAADVEHGRCRQQQREVEVEVVALVPRAEHVVQLGEAGIGEQAVDHGASLPRRRRHRDRITAVP